jgi:hypothetical protein
VHEDFKYTQLSGISPNIVNNGFKVEPINWYNTYVFGMPKSGESTGGGVKGNFYWDKKVTFLALMDRRKTTKLKELETIIRRCLEN